MSASGVAGVSIGRPHASPSRATGAIQGLSNSNDGGAVTVTSGVPGFPTEAFTSTTAVSKHVDYLGTVRGRFGVLLNANTLLYGTGGLAYGGVHAATSITQTDTGILPGPASVTYASAASVNTTHADWRQVWAPKW